VLPAAQVPDFQKFPIAVSASRAEKNYLAKQEAKTGVKPAAGTTLCDELYDPWASIILPFTSIAVLWSMMY
jgi:hypothetical protein